MTWVRIDDKAMQHPKLLRAGPEGVCLWLAGLCHCNAFATDGRIHKALVPALYPPIAARAKRIGRLLVELGLWLDDGQEHYSVHDYQYYQHAALKEEAEARLKEAEERRRRERERKAAYRAGRNGGCPGSVPPMSHGTNGTSPAGHTNGQTTGLSQGQVAPVPRARDHAPAGVSRPDPSRPVPDQDLEGSQRFGVVVAFSDRGPSKTPPPPFDETSQNFTSAAAGHDSTANGDPRLTSREAAAMWHRVMGMPNAGIPGAAHPHELWRTEFETIAAACNGVEGKPSLALRVATEWFWLAPSGPVQANRVSRSAATPEVFARGIVRDLEGALEWWTQRKQQSELAHKIAD
jgi:hypothetical protein